MWRLAALCHHYMLLLNTSKDQLHGVSVCEIYSVWRKCLVGWCLWTSLRFSMLLVLTCRSMHIPEVKQQRDAAWSLKVHLLEAEQRRQVSVCYSLFTDNNGEAFPNRGLHMYYLTEVTHFKVHTEGGRYKLGKGSDPTSDTVFREKVSSPRFQFSCELNLKLQHHHQVHIFANANLCHA